MVLIWFATTTFAAYFQAKVIHIADGDTITVLKENIRQVRIRLNEIDYPEKNLAYAKKAKEFPKALAQGERVSINNHGQDKYGRTIGDVI